MPRKLSDIHQRILSVLQAHPEGISITAMRNELGLAADEHQHLDRRVRDLDRTYIIKRTRRGNATLYVLHGERDEPLVDTGVSQPQRARILWRAQGRCEMCGRSTAEDGVKLHIDHKIPQDWGGASDDDNLWALCSTCNEGKKNFFATIVDPRIQQAMLHPSVHVRLGELLKAFEGEPVSAEYLEMVAHTHDDWQRRLRELRRLGWNYTYTKHKNERGRIRVNFVLTHWEPWPEDPATAIREAEGRKHTNR